MIRPYLEKCVFGFLDEIEVGGDWTKENLLAYLGELQKKPAQPSASEKAIRESSDAKRAARKNHELFFRYLGALYYTETTLVAPG